jgi:hypothetical protein
MRCNRNDFDHRGGAIPFAGSKRLLQFGAITAFTALDLGEFTYKLPSAAVQIIVDRLALGVETKSRRIKENLSPTSG